jgi:hypothetical protein
VAWLARRGRLRRDSITTGDGFVWVAYANGASSTGGSGESTIVQYEHSGNIVVMGSSLRFVSRMGLHHRGPASAMRPDEQDPNGLHRAVEATTLPLARRPAARRARGYSALSYNRRIPSPSNLS